jgi:hypothetical protein
MAACCPGGGDGDAGGGHRRTQADCALPDTCPSAQCAAVFGAFFGDCEAMLAQTGPAELALLRDFHASCQELEASSQQMLDSATPAMIFHLLVVDEATLPPPPPTPPTPPGPPDASSGSAEAVEEFRRVCTRGNLQSCAPVCLEVTYGFLLSIEIDGRGTVMTCNKYDGAFSWQGQASLGGYIGADIASFVSSVVSGAAGTFMATLTAAAGILATLTIEPGQLVLVAGDSTLVAAPAWGSGGFIIQERASLSLSFIELEGAIVLEPGATALTLSDCTNVNAITGSGIEVPSGATFMIESTIPINLVYGPAPMDGHLVIRGPVTCSNANVITLRCDGIQRRERRA